MAEQFYCIRCGAVLQKDDVALTRKMVKRGAQEFLWIPCLAEHFKLTEEILRQKVEEFRAMGCTLFR